MPDRRDFLSVCNDQGIPLTDFQTTFCVRCVQPECSRSRAGGLFETRVATWQERLLSPPRMAKDDPLYVALAAKRFIEIDTGPIPEVRGPAEWLDPRAIPDQLPAPVERPRPAKPPPNPPAQPSAPGEAPRAGVSRAPLNTPFVQGRMLDGAPAAAPKPDRWAVDPATPATPSEAAGAPIVKVGAKIKFGGG